MKYISEDFEYEFVFHIEISDLIQVIFRHFIIFMIQFHCMMLRLFLEISGFIIEFEIQ